MGWGGESKKAGGAHPDPICFIHSPAPTCPRAPKSSALREILTLPFQEISP